MTFPLLMAGSAVPTLSCAPDDVVAWGCVILGFGLSTFVHLLLSHILRR